MVGVKHGGSCRFYLSSETSALCVQDGKSAPIWQKSQGRRLNSAFSPCLMLQLDCRLDAGWVFSKGKISEKMW